MRSRPELKLDWCSHEAALYAVEHWHYSRRMPKSKVAKIGVWEAGQFIGVVLFGVGATPSICKPYGLQSTEVCELVRVALAAHAAPVSRIVAIALKLLRRAMPGLRLVVSYADPQQGHAGGIYQAGNWFYTGQTHPNSALKINGVVRHRRGVHAHWGHQGLGWVREHVDPRAERVSEPGKHKYLMPLDDEMREKIAPLAKPYPKRGRSVESDTPGPQPGEGGAHPTRPLHSTGGD